MKKSIAVVFSLGLIFLWAGCASSKAAVIFDQKDPIALVSVASNGDINWKDEDPIDPNSAGFFSSKALREDPDLVFVTNAGELINTAERIFRDSIAESTLISLAEKETVLNSGVYRNARAKKQSGKNKAVSAAGYRLVDYRDRNFPQALAKETGMQRSMFVEFNFTKVMISGFGKNGRCRAEITMLVVVNNAQGKTVYRNIFSSWSDSAIKVSGGNYSQSELLALFEPAIKNICQNFIGHR